MSIEVATHPRMLSIRMLLLAGLAAVALVLAMPVAQAAAGDSGSIYATTMRSCPDTRCSALKSVPATSVPVYCWRDGSGRWFRINHSGLVGWVAASSMYRQPSVPYCSDMRANETLFAGQSVWSTNGSYRIIMQSDGNLVLYGPSGALWSTRTTGTSSSNRAVMQGDGNFVVYNNSNSPVYHTGTYGHTGATLVVQADSNVVLYTGSTPLFATSWHRSFGSSRAARNSAAWGWCTWLAYDRFHTDSGIWPYFAGDAGNWNNSAEANGWRVQTQPASRSIVVFEPWLIGGVGHVGWVEAIQLRPDGWYALVTEMNYDGSATRATGHVRTIWKKHVNGMSYIMSPEL